MREFFGDEPFVVMAADALTDIDLGALAKAHARERRDRHPGDEAGHERERVRGRRHRRRRPGPGFQEKPDPAEALSDLANCMIYVLEPEIFDYFPDQAEVDFALDVFPALLDHDVPFDVHETDDYWNDVGSLPEYLQGNLDVVGARSASSRPASGSAAATATSTTGRGRAARSCSARAPASATDVRLDGPAGDRARARRSATARGCSESVLLPGAEVAAEALRRRRDRRPARVVAG